MSRKTVHQVEAVYLRDALYRQLEEASRIQLPDTEVHEMYFDGVGFSSRPTGVIINGQEETAARKQFYDGFKNTIEAAINGNLEDACEAALMLPNEYRGHFAVLMFLCDMPLAGYQPAFRAIWEHDHREVIAAAGNRNRLRAMFRKAQFSLPDHLPEVVRIWRGTSYLSFGKAIHGYSWTINRDCACWFAMRFAAKNGKPLVIAVDVPRAAILSYSDERAEAEAVCFDVPLPFIDGTEEDWKEGHNRHQIRNMERDEALNSPPLPDAPLRVT